MTRPEEKQNDLPCEYGKHPGRCRHPEVIEETGRAIDVPEKHCRGNICMMWEPNRIRLATMKRNEPSENDS